MLHSAACKGCNGLFPDYLVCQVFPGQPSVKIKGRIGKIIERRELTVKSLYLTTLHSFFLSVSLSIPVQNKTRLQ